jgi:hypothetical protein
MRKRQPKTFTAVRGALESRADSKKEARAYLEKMVDYACAWHSSHLETRFGYLIAIMHTPLGYESMVIDPARLAEHGRTHSASCFSGDTSLDQEIQRGRMNAAQLAWHRGENDEKFLAATGLDEIGQMELLRWIRFQRLYADHIAAGATPAEAHNRAGRGIPVEVAA